MSKATLNLTEMYDADVKFISLVKRGANKIPFRIIKSEDGNMIDLGKLFTTQKTAEAPAPTIVGFAVAKSDKTEGFIAALKSEGYEFTQEDINDGGAVLTVKTADPENITTVKLNEDVAVMIEGVKKGFYGYSDSTDFTEKMSTDGFYSSLYTAMSVLGDTVCSTMYKADNGAPVEIITKAFQDAQNYVTSLVTAIPVSCFKLEKIKPVVTTRDEPPAESPTEPDGDEEVECKACGGKMKKGSECKACGGKGPKKEETTKADSKTCPECGATCATDATTCSSCKATLTVKKEEVDLLASLTGMFETLTTTLTQKLETEISVIKATVDDAKALAQKSDETLNSVILGAGTHPEPVKKAAEKIQTTAVFHDILKFDGFEDK